MMFSSCTLCAIPVIPDVRCKVMRTKGVQAGLHERLVGGDAGAQHILDCCRHACCDFSQLLCAPRSPVTEKVLAAS